MDRWPSKDNSWTNDRPVTYSPELAPVTVPVHALENLDSLYDRIYIDPNFADLIRRKMVSVKEFSKRQSLEMLVLSHEGSSIEVTIWLIPVFHSGLLVHVLFAADEENRQNIEQYRSSTYQRPHIEYLAPITGHL